MNIWFNPKVAPAWILVAATTFVSGGVFLSWGRIQTVSAESQSNGIAQYRAGICRILHASETVELGAYYYQPTSGTPDFSIGSLLPEGVYICDLFGRSGRIERGGYVQFVEVATDISSVNEELQKRLADPNSPDSSPASQVRRAWNLGVHQPRPTNQFFDLQPRTSEKREG